MPRIGLYAADVGASAVVKLPDESRIANEAVRRGDILDPVTFPEAIGRPERRHPALRGHAGAGEYSDVRRPAQGPGDLADCRLHFVRRHRASPEPTNGNPT